MGSRPPERSTQPRGLLRSSEKGKVCQSRHPRTAVGAGEANARRSGRNSTISKTGRSGSWSRTPTQQRTSCATRSAAATAILSARFSASSAPGVEVTGPSPLLISRDPELKA